MQLENFTEFLNSGKDSRCLSLVIIPRTHSEARSLQSHFLYISEDSFIKS